MNGAKTLLLCRPPCVASTFTPLSLSPALWLKADGVLWQDSARTTLATADGDPVGAWDDASGNARHATQGTAAKRPLLKLAIQNGVSVLRFDNVDDALGLTSLAYGATWTLFLVCKKPTTGGYIVGSSAVGGAPAIITGYDPGSGPVSFEFYNTGGDRATLDASATGFHAMVVQWADAGNRVGWFDGVQVFDAATTVSHAADTMVSIGAADAAGTGSASDICEFMVVKAGITSAQVASWFAYAQAKWGTP